MPSGLYLGTCERCSCHGHTEVCEPETGACQVSPTPFPPTPGVCGLQGPSLSPTVCLPQECQHHTEGPRCEQCQPGYYGDAQRGTPHDCQPCPCHGAPAAGQCVQPLPAPALPEMSIALSQVPFFPGPPERQWLNPGLTASSRCHFV